MLRLTIQLAPVDWELAIELAGRVSLGNEKSPGLFGEALDR